jgi:hypothetical protein
MLPRCGDVLQIGAQASVQFAGGRGFLFRVIRVMDQETRETYADWAWLEGYELGGNGEAVERRQIFVRSAGLQVVTPKKIEAPCTCPYTSMRIPHRVKCRRHRSGYDRQADIRDRMEHQVPRGLTRPPVIPRPRTSPETTTAGSTR